MFFTLLGFVVILEKPDFFTTGEELDEEFPAMSDDPTPWEESASAPKRDESKNSSPLKTDENPVTDPPEQRASTKLKNRSDPPRGNDI